ncbi:MAG: choice-of-anchor J domain-containing protein [Bacteroidetes bacterium]|nr:choice-of-anchor J domain-containing protein [Bacteroidota bacterium]
MKKIFYLLFPVSLVFTSCKKKFDTPDPLTPPAIGGYITIDSIIKRYNVYYAVPPSKVYKFTTDVNVTGIVTADEISGNLYKSVYIKDATGGMKLNLTYSGGLYIGDSIRVNLKGVKLNSYGNQIQLDSIDLEKSVHKISSGTLVIPRKVTMNQLITTNTLVSQLYFQSELVELDSVEFAIGSKGTTFADAVNKGSISHVLLNSFGSKVIVRSSGYANFAASIVPCGKGKIIAIVGQYNGAIQLTIRQLTDVSISTGTCPVYVKSFNDNSITSGGWTTQNVTGNINWVTSNAGGAPTYYAAISNYISGNQACETWLISPPFNLTNNINPALSFNNAYNYTGPALVAMISTNYTGGAVSTASWTALPYTASTGGFNFVNSGNISLNAYKTAGVTIAFKYTGTSTSGSTWELDDIAILDN